MLFGSTNTRTSWAATTRSFVRGASARSIRYCMPLQPPAMIRSRREASGRLSFCCKTRIRCTALSVTTSGSSWEVIMAIAFPSRLKAGPRLKSSAASFVSESSIKLFDSLATKDIYNDVIVSHSLPMKGGVCGMVSKSVLQEQMAKQEYKYGFVADFDEDTIPKGLNEDVVRLISRKKKEPEWMTDWRLRAYRHWLTMKEPTWSNVRYPPINYQDIIYYAAPKPKKEVKSLEDVDPEIRSLYAKLGIPLQEQERLAGVAVEAVLDSVSVATTFKDKLAELGIIFCSFSEAVQEHSDLVRKYLGTVVPFNDNFFAGLNSAVFSDGSFAYVPPGVRCPMELSTYFRINAQDTGQFERTLIIADEGAYVSYLEGCTAPIRDTNQLHAAVVELIALDNAEIKYSTIQNWYPGDKEGKGGIYNFVTKRGKCLGA